MADAILEVVPDYMSALVGYRAWNATPEGGLLSMNQDPTMPWPSKYRMHAACTVVRERIWAGGMGGIGAAFIATTQAFLLPRGVVTKQYAISFSDWWGRKRRQREVESHHPPEKYCHCGIYAAKSDESHHFQSYAVGARVWGEVYLWGKMQEYSEGYRAEFAYPKSLKTRDATLAEKIGRQYGVPCETVEPFAPEVEGLSVQTPWYTLWPRILCRWST